MELLTSALRKVNGMITVGSKVRLRGCKHGEPGTVLRIEHGRLVVLWGELDFLARHHPKSLIEVEVCCG